MKGAVPYEAKVVRRGFSVRLCLCCVLAYQSLNTPPKPDLPTQEYVREHGYPVNESGETYGPNVEGFDAPDLILAHPQGKLQGYLKESEDPHWSVSHVLSGLRI